VRPSSGVFDHVRRTQGSKLYTRASEETSNGTV
jgi:hypothetical protein